MNVGKSVKRVEAYDKVIGRANFTADLVPHHHLVAKILHSTIANGEVASIDTTAAVLLHGVVKVVTCFDVPDIAFPTAGHPWSTEPSHQDIADRKLLNKRVRFYGDDIAAVVAVDEVTAKKALRLIKVKYNEFTPITTIEQAMSEGATKLHEAKEKNILAYSRYEIGDFDEAIKEEGLKKVHGYYKTQMVNQVPLENPISYAYMENDRIVIVTSTQIPHIVRRVVGQALSVGWGKIRVIKPYIGGGFGLKQDVLYEPLNAYLCAMVGGKCVKLELTREETFVCTRTRHAIDFELESYVRADGSFAARTVRAFANSGAYASHGHSIVANATASFRQLYPVGAIKSEAYSIYTNLPVAGAMRGYGIPQMNFALESHIEDISRQLDIDSLAMREKNMMKLGYVDPGTTITCHSTGLQECINKGKARVDYDKKLAVYKSQGGTVRKGIGMAIFSYKTGTYPISLETASARLILNQDGSINVSLGATEIGQGADTVFAQMVADTVNVPLRTVQILSTQDTDVTPFDTAAYASRQSYVTGKAIKKTALIFKEKIINYGSYMLQRNPEELDIENGRLIDIASGGELLTVQDIAMEAFYSRKSSVHITAESTLHCTENTFSFGVTFAEIELDMAFCSIKVTNILNMHDSGVILNPALAEAQVHGGMSMGLGYALGEQMLFDPITAKPLNNNLLDYKLMTAIDTPKLSADFVDVIDPTGPYGNKALGEPPTISIAAAVRNAVLNATGYAINSIPLNPEKLFLCFKDNGQI